VQGENEEEQAEKKEEKRKEKKKEGKKKNLEDKVWYTHGMDRIERKLKKK